MLAFISVLVLFYDSLELCACFFSTELQLAILMLVGSGASLWCPQYVAYSWLSSYYKSCTSIVCLFCYRICLWQESLRLCSKIGRWNESMKIRWRSYYLVFLISCSVLVVLCSYIIWKWVSKYWVESRNTSLLGAILYFIWYTEYGIVNFGKYKWAYFTWL